MTFRRLRRNIRLWGFGLLAPLALGGMGSRPPPASLESDVRHFNRVLVEFFRPNYMLPVAVPAGQSVGDVYDAETWVLAERARTCFPNLSEPRRGATSLPALTRIATRHTGLAVGVATILNLEGGVDAARTVEIRFLDTRYAEVAAGDLRRALTPLCEHLRPIVDEQRERIASSRRPPVIIGYLVTGRKQIFIGVRDAARLGIQADALRAALAAAGGPTAAGNLLPFDVRLALQGEFGSRQGVVVETREPVPIAFKPAFLVDLIAGLRLDDPTRGPGAPADGTRGDVGWTAFEPDTNADHRRIFDELTSAYLQTEHLGTGAR